MPQPAIRLAPDSPSSGGIEDLSKRQAKRETVLIATVSPDGKGQDWVGPGDVQLLQAKSRGGKSRRGNRFGQGSSQVCTQVVHMAGRSGSPDQRAGGPRGQLEQPSPARPGIPARANGEASCAGPFLVLFLIDHGIKLTEGEFQSDLGGAGAGLGLDDGLGTWGPEC
ncbi:hypothetical protein P7K49_020337 [Saguinus oedipus]|uniref:Uncharacterized protein n=1 Tax=Saguinus oedipus TaxID=9490 RepID=A0ABQ9V0M8_SAGOE|nr:hypothetical protein P7K49_020337 [Saguinus oedipus]